jgi:cytochrome oxidase assembly protein ShyY1
VYRFLLSPRWIGFVVFVLLIMVGCLLLANWQLDRLDERNARNDVVKANIEQPPVPVSALVDEGEALPDDALWRQATITGRYDEDFQRLWRKRPFQGRVGFHVLAPIVADDGTALWVDRGWIPPGNSALSQPEVPALPEGTVTATVRLRKASTGAARADDLPPAQIDRVAVGELSTDLPASTYVAYGELVSEDPPTEPAPAPVPAPKTAEGPHLSYALQWVCFAIIAVVGLIVFVRKERERGADDQERLTAEAGAPAP